MAAPVGPAAQPIFEDASGDEDEELAGCADALPMPPSEELPIVDAEEAPPCQVVRAERPTTTNTNVALPTPMIRGTQMCVKAGVKFNKPFVTIHSEMKCNLSSQEKYVRHIL